MPSGWLACLSCGESRESKCVWGAALGGCAGGKKLGVDRECSAVAARALIRECGKGKDSGLREGERKSAAETQLKFMEHVVRRVQIGLVCSADLRGVSALLRHSLRVVVVSPVASEDSCWGHTMVWLAGGGLVS